ncbi:uncharacterized protein K02A2.6 [Trichonephila clavipes]|uniref:RNA-directed DNA polymerase n=1 Tax=Trichonephila clavipes TaxID=2585209 RepID=A0A8X6VIL3_TRICX|nr:uncharacterized protein K02A2.6 [Trichonephila clavipes]
MEQQIADLLRQNQDLIRALQIREDSHSHKVTVQFEKFDEENENFDSFIERFETYLDVQNVPIANRAKVFVSSLSAKLYQLLKNLLAPDIPSDQTLDKLKDALKKHLTPKPLIIPSRHKFLNRKQTEGEGISTYIAELRALAMNCDYDQDMLNIMLRDVFMSQIEALPVTSKELRQETSKDIELGPLLRALREGKDLQGREAQYTIEDGCIMYGQRVCIPRKFRKNVLEELHAGHLGIVKMKAIARSFVYWKNIDNDIEEAAKNCVDCARYKADPPKSKVHYWEYPSMPWERIHVDFAGPIFEHTFFLIVDAHSKWLEVYPMKVLVSDNGSQFTSYEFQRFMHKNGVRHKTSAPFKPSSNGQAERYVATLKQSLRAMHKYEGTIQQKLSTFLMQYPKAPNVTTTLSPAMLFLKRDIRTRIDLLLPELKTKIQDKLRRDNFEFRDRKFDVGDRVAVRVYRAANTRWKFGTIVNQDGVLHNIIDVQGTLVRRHVDQIRPVGDKVQENIIPLMHQRFPSSEVRENNSNIQHAETAEDISKDRNKELGSSSVQGVPSTDVAVPDLSQSSAKETDSETRSPPVPDRPFPRRSGRIRRPPERLVL